MEFPLVLHLLFDDSLFISLVLKFITTKEFEHIFFFTNRRKITHSFSIGMGTWGHWVRGT